MVLRMGVLIELMLHMTEVFHLAKSCVSVLYSPYYDWENCRLEEL